MLKRPIAISLSPNTEKDDVILALKVLSSPIRWFNFRETEKLEKEFERLFGKGFQALAVNSGRSALYLILKTLGVREGAEVAIQALTCVAVPNAILWLGGKPLYIDVDASYNMDPQDLKKKITKNTKAIIVQHSFGIPANLKEIKKIAQKRKICLIEDCALALGGKYNNKLLGSHGDISFFSFGRDKVISSVFGGMILCKEKSLRERLLDERDKLDYPGPYWVIQQLLHPILFSLILLFYNTGHGRITIGKILLFLFQRLGILSKAVYWQEELGQKPKVFPTKLPGALSVLALNQLYKLNRFNQHRRQIADIYFQKLKVSGFGLPKNIGGSIWMRFPITHDKSKSILTCARRKGVLLGDWYKDIVVPVRNLSLAGYERGSCPNAQLLAGKILNLPTYPSLKVELADSIVQLVKSCQDS